MLICIMLSLMKSHLFILLLCALLGARLLIMATTPVFEPSEARYAAISANMARTGDWFVPSFTYEGVYPPGSRRLSFRRRRRAAGRSG